MALQGQPRQELDKLTLGGSGWSPFQYQISENSSNIESHLWNPLALDNTSFEDFSALETSYLPHSITFDVLEPFQCIDQSFPLHFGDLQLHGLSHDSRCNTAAPIPAPGKVYGGGSAVNDSQSPFNSPSASSPLQNAFAAMQGSHGIADIEATICSLVAEHLNRLGGLGNIQSTTTPLPATNDPHSPPDTKASSRIILVDSQGHKPSHRSRKAQKLANSGLVKHSEDKVAR